MSNVTWEKVEKREHDHAGYNTYTDWVPVKQKGKGGKKFDDSFVDYSNKALQEAMKSAFGGEEKENPNILKLKAMAHMRELQNTADEIGEELRKDKKYNYLKYLLNLDADIFHQNLAGFLKEINEESTEDFDEVFPKDDVALYGGCANQFPDDLSSFEIYERAVLLNDNPYYVCEWAENVYSDKKDDFPQAYICDNGERNGLLLIKLNKQNVINLVDLMLWAVRNHIALIWYDEIPPIDFRNTRITKEFYMHVMTYFGENMSMDDYQISEVYKGRDEEGKMFFLLKIDVYYFAKLVKEMVYDFS